MHHKIFNFLILSPTLKLAVTVHQRKKKISFAYIFSDLFDVKVIQQSLDVKKSEKEKKLLCGVELK